LSEHLPQALEDGRHGPRRQSPERFDQTFPVNGPELIHRHEPGTLLKAARHTPGVRVPARRHRCDDSRPQVHVQLVRRHDHALNERKEKIRLLSSLLQTSKASSIPPDQIARITRELDENKQKVALYQQKQNVLNYRLQDMNTRAYRLQSQAEQASQSKLASMDEPQREALSLRSNAIDRQRAGMNVQIYDLTTSLQQLKEEAAVRSQEFDEVGTLKALIERAEETGATDMCEIVLSVLDEQDTDRAREAAKELNCDRE
jgi:hypothetical protein